MKKRKKSNTYDKLLSAVRLELKQKYRKFTIQYHDYTFPVIKSRHTCGVCTCVCVCVCERERERERERESVCVHVYMYVCACIRIWWHMCLFTIA